MTNKWLILVLSAALLAACSQKEPKTDSEHTQQQGEQKPVDSVQSDQETKQSEQRIANLKNEQIEVGTSISVHKQIVTIMHPLEQFEELTDEEIKEVLTEEGAQEVTVKTDEKLVEVKMPIEQFETRAKSLKKKLHEMIDSINTNKIYPSIKTVEANDNFTRIKVIVNEAEFETSFDSLAVFSVVTSILYYYSSIGDLEKKIEVAYINKATNQVFRKEVYPE